MCPPWQRQGQLICQILGGLKPPQPPPCDSPASYIFLAFLHKQSRHSSSGLVCIKMILNEIINISHHRGDDYFREIFSNPIINWTIILIWLLGLVSCVFLRIVSWFEKTGQAGPFRTLVNRLFSCIIDQVGSPYLLFQIQQNF